MGNAVSHGTKRSSLLHVWLMTEVEAYQPVFTVDHNRYLLEPLIEAVAYVFTGPNQLEEHSKGKKHKVAARAREAAMTCPKR